LSAPFVYSERIRPPDCDRQGVLGHARYLRFFEAALIELWREAIGPYGDTVGSGVDLAVAQTSVRYLAPARFDDALDVAVTIRDIGTTALTVAFDASVAGRPVAHGETRYVCIDAASGRKAPVPDAVSAGLAGHMSEAVTA
jgi:acyl-CoA thioester hydrolase